MTGSRLQLADWRRQVGEMYASIRRHEPRPGWELFRAERDRLLKAHPQSPLDAADREAFQELQYFSYDPSWRLVVELAPPQDPWSSEIHLGEDGRFEITEIGQVPIKSEASLSMFWVEGYGGGLFLPFGDATNGNSTYGGGRYLLDGIKGADLGMEHDRLVLDFNFAYNPSCVYDERWVCPLPPERNRLQFEVRAGEKTFQ